MDGALFREIMGTFPAGVVVVTATEAAGKHRGLTVSAFCPVSLDPPLVLVCVDRTSNTLPAIRESGGFSVNILCAGRQELARFMASKHDDKFVQRDWRPAPVGEAGPVLHGDTAAWIACRTERAIEAGDHWVFIARVMDGGVRPGEIPLAYSRRAFFELRAAEQAPE